MFTNFTMLPATSFTNLFKRDTALMFLRKERERNFSLTKSEILSKSFQIFFVTLLVRAQMCDIRATRFIKIVDTPRMQIVLGTNFSRTAHKCVRIANVQPRLFAQLITDVIVIPRRIHGIPVDLGQGLNRIRRSDWRSIRVSANKSAACNCANEQCGIAYKSPDHLPAISINNSRN